jgi:ketosteroid isomerase-like protein
MVRFPASWRALSGLTLGLLRPPSRLRRTFLRRAVLSGWAAVGRRDFEVALVRYAPDVEFETFEGLQALGLTRGRGHKAMRKALSALADDWERWQLTPSYMLDMGDRLLVLGSARVGGRASGLELDSGLAQLLTLAGGLVAREQDFPSWVEGLRAADLDPNAITLFAHPGAGRAPSSAGG